MEFRETNIGEWNREKEMRDKALERWERSVKIKRCSCGRPYSYGYYPVNDDPGECQYCRDAEGDLVL
jgi:hypothetical protein